MEKQRRSCKGCGAPHHNNNVKFNGIDAALKPGVVMAYYSCMYDDCKSTFVELFDADFFSVMQSYPHGEIVVDETAVQKLLLRRLGIDSFCP